MVKRTLTPLRLRSQRFYRWPINKKIEFTKKIKAK